MSTLDIQTELRRLQAEERTAVFQKLCELQEADLLRGVGPTAMEKKMLEETFAEYQHDSNSGAPWREVLGRIQMSGEP